MRAFNYNGIAKGEAIKTVSTNVIVQFVYTGATDLICYVKTGISDNYMSEIVDSSGTAITRFVATGTGTQQILLPEMVPGSAIAIDTVSGTGTVTANFLTGIER